MWCIKDSAGEVVKANIILDAKQYGRELPKGFDGEQRNGFSFFELVEYEIEEGVFVEEEEYITSRITETPTLFAVTNAQFKNWAKKKIIAKPAIFTYSEQQFKEVLNLKTG